MHPRPTDRLRAALGRHIHAEQKGQSLTELAIFTPIMTMLVLIASNVGLAVHAHITLTQATQQAAQYLLNHPADTSSCATPVQVSCVESVTAAEMASYLDGDGFHNTTVTVT